MVSDGIFQIYREADLVISKGMANFELFWMRMPETGLFAMLITKYLPRRPAAGVKPARRRGQRLEILLRPFASYDCGMCLELEPRAGVNRTAQARLAAGRGLAL